MLDQAQIKNSQSHRFQSLHALYENKQQWVRHYETMLGQINPISTTLSLGIAAFLAENHIGNNIENIFLLVPAVLILFTTWFNWWCDKEIRRQFDQIVIAEKGMGFYNYQVEGKAVLPKEYENSPHKTRPIILAGYVLQLISFCVLVGVIFTGISQ